MEYVFQNVVRATPQPPISNGYPLMHKHAHLVRSRLTADANQNKANNTLTGQ